MHLLPILLTLLSASTPALTLTPKFIQNPILTPANKTESTIIHNFLMGPNYPGVDPTTPDSLIKTYPKCAQTCAKNFYDAYFNQCDKWLATVKNVEAGWSCVCAHVFGVKIQYQFPYDLDLTKCAQDACDDGNDIDTTNWLGEVEARKVEMQDFCQRTGIVQNISVGWSMEAAGGKVRLETAGVVMAAIAVVFVSYL